MTVSRRLRFEVLKRDGFTCRYCGAKSPDVVLQVDHVIPVALGGGDEPSNLITSCADCNAGKGSSNPDDQLVEDVDATAALFAKAIERAAAVRGKDLDSTDAICARFYEEWSGLFGDGDWAIAPDWQSSLERFLASGLTWADFDRFITKVVQNRIEWHQRFRYFCGCCWREISTRQELARQMIERGEV